MRVLLDNNVHGKFAEKITGHSITLARALGWNELFNGDLITAAEGAGFEVLITADKSMQYQQKLAGRKISVFVLNSRFIKWDSIEPLASQVQGVLDGGVAEASFIVVNPREE